MKTLISTVVAVCMALVMFGVTPVFAQNFEFFDETVYGVELASDDLILNSDHVEIGGYFTSRDVMNFEDDIRIVGKVKVKGYSIFDWRTTE